MGKTKSRENIHFLEQILNIPDKSDIIGIRDALILEMFYSTGIRVSELSHLKLDNIDFDNRKIKVFGKGSTWSADTSYQTSDIVLPSAENGCMYEFDSYIGTSGQSEPPAAEDSTTYDNNLVWFKIDKNASAKAWEADTLYAMGAIVDLSSDENSSYQMIGFRDKAGTTPAIWPTPESDNREIQIGNLVFKCYNSIDSKGNYKNPMLDYDWNQYLHVNYSLSIAE